MRSILILLLTFASFSLQAQSIFVNEYLNSGTKEGEWVELVTTEIVDIRGYKLRDHSGSGGPQSPLIFSNDELWAAIPSGTIIVLIGTSVAENEDTDASDGLLIIKTDNTIYISGNQFNVSETSEAIQVLDASDNHIHGISHGTRNAATLPAPKAHFKGTVASNSTIGYQGTISLSDLVNNDKLKSISTPSLGGGNDTDNSNLIFSFKEAVEEATMKLDQAGTPLTNGANVDFGSMFIGDEKYLKFTITNLGKSILTVTNLQISSPSDFVIAGDFTSNQLENLDTSEFEIAFRAATEGLQEATLSFETNDQSAQTVTLNLSATALSVGESQPISVVKNLELGTVVSVSGRVTVANEFGGPVYMQDATSGIAVYFNALHTDVQRGDSVKVTGPLAEFGTTAAGKGLLQISGSNITYTKYNVEPELQEPIQLSISGIQEVHQSQLITISGVTFTDTGSFQGNRNYVINDGTGSTEVRIDGDITSLVGAEIPTEPITLTAVISRYAGANQLMPRDAADMNVQAVEIPYSDIPDSETFDVATWNLVWFGSDQSGPEDENLQIENAATVMKTMNSDVYFLQEISNDQAFKTLVSKLDGYRGFIAPISQTQKTAYIYKTSVVDSLSAAFISTNWSQSSSWASGRYPYEFIVRATINGESKTLYLLNIHAKALSDFESYTRRFNDIAELKELLDNQRSASNLVFMGDFNDFVLKTTYEGSTVSPYAEFVADTIDYKVVTKSLEERGFTSYSRFSMLDHIIISNEMFDSHLNGAEQIENPVYIGNYLSTTSDHFPVKTRFMWGKTTSVTDESTIQAPSSATLYQNYPNPFNPNTTINYSLNKASTVSLTVYSVIGKKVATLIESKSENIGTHSVQFNASELASGVYIYQLKTSDGIVLNRLMNLVK